MKKLIDPIKNELNIVNNKLFKTEKQLKAATKKQELLAAEVAQLTKEKEQLSIAIDSLEGRDIKRLEYVYIPQPYITYPPLTNPFYVLPIANPNYPYSITSPNLSIEPTTFPYGTTTCFNVSSNTNN